MMVAGSAVDYDVGRKAWQVALCRGLIRRPPVGHEMRVSGK
jgi:hypothetical protein